MAYETSPCNFSYISSILYIVLLKRPLRKQFPELSTKSLFNIICTDLQKHESTLLHSPYVCTKQIFDSLQFIYDKIFLKKLL